ncbi:heterokaryon incompatibility protein-domain-containing protein [Paraphoma chrysanthemicola]|nr:heterokaryon incompatibility protein-domain-containing protein [Paraphoma chrysanthemicola]
MVQTTSKNISSFAQEIPWSAMPRTFQDAVSFVRKLSIAYLWIDSLCIIQDSDLDWQQQSANMASIYQNAYITLAATHSADSSGGCFTSDSLRSTHDYEPLAILRFHDGTEHNLSFRRTLIRSSQPLLWRGWAYQERILSPRVLHFAGEELVWECGTVYDSESNSHNFKAFFFHSKQDRNIRWGRIVQDYFRRSLTFPSDIFPALSGIVKVVAAQLQDEYAAGLWKRTIIQDLLWYFTTRPGSTDLSTTATTAEVWRAPSWSWASMTTPARDLNIQYLPASQNLAEVTNIVCKPAGADTTGQLAMAHLTISAKALLGHLVCSSPPTARHSPYEVIVGNFAIRKSPWYESNEATHFGLDSFHHAHQLEPLEVIIVQLAKHTDITKTHVPWTSEDTETVHEVRSYMILTRDSTDPDHWIRIGLVAIDIVEPAPSLRDDVRDSVQITGEGDLQQQQALASFVAELQQEASLPRQLTHLFAEAETQEFVVW